MKNTTFKNKIITLSIPIVATTALVYAETQDYTPGHYIIIGSQTQEQNQFPSISISGGSTSYKTYTPGEQVVPFQNYNPPQWNLYNTILSTLGNLSLGAGYGLYNMNLSNPNNLAGVFGEIASANAFGQLTLASMLYAVGTYAPVLKEAIVGADNISKQMTMFTAQAINSALNTINSLPSGVKQAVQSCVTYNLTGGQNGGQFAGLSLNQVMSYFNSSTASQSGFDSLIDQCMQGENIAQMFNYSSQSIDAYLNQFNPRYNWMLDDIQQASLTTGPNGNNLYASDTIADQSASLYSLFNPKLVAKDMLIAAQPEVQYNQSTHNIQPQFVYITIPPSSPNSSSSKLLVSIGNFDQDIKAIVDKQIDATLMSMTNASSFSTFYNQYVVPVNNVLSLTGNDLRNAWYAIYMALQVYLYASSNGTLPPPNDYTFVTPKDLNEMKLQMDSSIDKLKKLYIAYFKKDTLKYLQQDALQNEQKYKAEQEMNSKPAPSSTQTNQNTIL